MLMLKRKPKQIFGGHFLIPEIEEIEEIIAIN